MKKVLTIAMVTLLVIIISGVCIKQHYEIKALKETENTKEIKIEKCKEVKLPKKNQNTEEVIESADEYIKVAVAYIKAIKTGSSTDTYDQRVKRIKNLMSDELFNQIAPGTSGNEENSVEEHDSSIVINTKVVDIISAYSKINDKKYDVTIIYSVRMTDSEHSKKQRYLSRMTIEKIKDSLILTNIYEDSMLSDGFY